MLTYKIHLYPATESPAPTWRAAMWGSATTRSARRASTRSRSMSRDKDYPPVEKIYTSPLRRCRETAHILLPRLQDL